MRTHRVSEAFTDFPFERVEALARHVLDLDLLFSRSPLNRSSVGQESAQEQSTEQRSIVVSGVLSFVAVAIDGYACCTRRYRSGRTSLGAVDVAAQSPDVLGGWWWSEMENLDMAGGSRDVIRGDAKGTRPLHG